jgi:pimeloyl-ACP methyl ester carboxylesterase
MNRKWFSFSFLIGSFFLILTSCNLFNQDDQIPITEDKYLISYVQKGSYVLPVVKALFQTVESKYPSIDTISNKMKYGVWVYKISYRTTYKNQEKVASGLVCVPMATGSFPLMSFQNGTNTLHSKAPSVDYNDELFLLIENLASAGFIVAMPDYLGFGTSESMFHPYLVKDPTVQTITDMYRAIVEMISKFPNLTLSQDTYLCGYSQGGWATMALKNALETKMSTEFTVKATSCGAGPYNLTEVSNEILGNSVYPMPYFFAYLLNSYIQAAEVNLTYADIFNSPYSGAGYISSLFDGTKDSEYINSKLTTNLNELFTQDFRTNYSTGTKFAPLRDAFTRNSIEAWKTTTPTLLIHGLGDSFVTPKVSQSIYTAFLAKGVDPTTIAYIPIPGLDHRDAVLPWGMATISYLLKIKNK